MPQPTVSLLSDSDIKSIHQTSLHILRDVGVRVEHEEVLSRLEQAGATVKPDDRVAYFDEDLIWSGIQNVGKSFTIYGRQQGREVRFGKGEQHLISSPGQFSWSDHHTGQHREPTLDDVRNAATLGDALPNISIVGALASAVDVPLPIRDVILTAELAKITGKPTRVWPISRQSTRYVLKIFEAIAGGSQALREKPMTETLLEPVSPLTLPRDGLDIALEFLAHGQPVSIGPMAMASATAPATLAGTLAQENAEILAANAVIQTLSPGTPILYGGIPHIMDPRTSICSFGSPEQSIMALAMVEMARFYELPVYVNVNLTDAKSLDVQAGMEKMGSFILAMMAGADLFGHAGIVGTDHGGNLAWLLVDDQAYSYAARIARGLSIDPGTLALDVTISVGPGGNFLGSKHTVDHFRKELWVPGSTWTRDSFEQWMKHGSQNVADRATAEVDRILQTHQPVPMDPDLEKEIDAIVDSARRHLLD